MEVLDFQQSASLCGLLKESTKVADADVRDGRLSFRIEPWKIRTFEIV